MLKSLVILVLFVLVGIASGQQPSTNAPKAGIAKSDGGGKGQVKPNSQTSNQASVPPMASSPQPSAPTCDEACQNSRKNLQIQNRLVWLTGGLVFVGLLQVLSMFWQAVLLRKTRGDVKRQADWIETQSGHMAAQVELMQKQLPVMEKQSRIALLQIRHIRDKERARLVISPVSEGFWEKLNKPSGFIQASVQVEHFGASDAFKVIGNFTAGVSSDTERPEHANMWESMQLPNVIRQGSSPFFAEHQLFLGKRPELSEVLQGKAYLVFFGFVQYEDVFGREHVDDFGFYWWVDRQAAEMGLPGNSRWENCDSEKSEHERKRLRKRLFGPDFLPSEKQIQNPN